MSQTSIADNMSKVFAGVLGDDSPQYVRSYVNEEATEEMVFGTLVVQGTADGDALLPTAGDQPLGVVTHSHRYAKDGELGDSGVKGNAMVGVLRRGTVWVQPEEAVVPGGAVRVRITATGSEVVGAFATAADGTDLAVLTNAEWLTTGSATVPALLEIDMNHEPVLTADT